jgi:hypothetical protein
MTTCGKCDATWTNQRTEHCMGCHQTFASTRAGDAHRVGPHDPAEGGRRCLSPEEMVARGLWATLRNGVQIWHGRAAKDGVPHRREVHR